VDLRRNLALSQSSRRTGGNAGWASVAKAIVVLSAIGLTGQLITSFQSNLETARLATNHDPLGQPAIISVSGDTVRISGPLAQGTAAKFTSILAHAPQVRNVSLSSIGGRLLEATQISSAVRARKLNTVVDGDCESACTFVLLAGERRSVEIGSRVGFHQPTYPGLTAEEQTEMVDSARTAYSNSGLPPSFVDRALQPGPDQMWYPTEPELFEAGVLNGFTHRRVIEDNQASAATVSKRIPQRIDDITTLESAKANGDELLFTYEISRPVEQFDRQSVQRLLTETDRRSSCSQPLAPKLLEGGAVFRFLYLDVRGKTIANVRIDHC